MMAPDEKGDTLLSWIRFLMMVPIACWILGTLIVFTHDTGAGLFLLGGGSAILSGVLWAMYDNLRNCGAWRVEVREMIERERRIMRSQLEREMKKPLE